MDIALGILEDHPLYKRFEVLKSNAEILKCEKVAFVDVGSSAATSVATIINTALDHFFQTKPLDDSYGRYNITKSIQRDGKFIVFAHPVVESLNAYLKAWDDVADRVHGKQEVILALGKPVDEDIKRIRQLALKLVDTNARVLKGLPLFKVEVDETKTRIDLRMKYVASFPKKTGMIRNQTLENWINACTGQYPGILSTIRDFVPSGFGDRYGRGCVAGRLQLSANVDRRMALMGIAKAMVEALERGVEDKTTPRLERNKYDPKCYRKTKPFGNVYHASMTSYGELLDEMKAARSKMILWATRPEKILNMKEQEILEWFHKFCKQEIADSEKEAVTNATPDNSAGQLPAQL